MFFCQTIQFTEKLLLTKKVRVQLDSVSWTRAGWHWAGSWSALLSPIAMPHTTTHLSSTMSKHNSASVGAFTSTSSHHTTTLDSCVSPQELPETNGFPKWPSHNECNFESETLAFTGSTLSRHSIIVPTLAQQAKQACALNNLH